MMTPLIIDNFAGGGGASTGIEAALGRSVDIAINHDEAAIAVHTANHPHTQHYCQSIYSVDPLEATGGAPVLLAWFSPDCKHHSKAKGGKPREKYIRDMAWVVPHWIERLLKATPAGSGGQQQSAAPQAIMLENVEEFRHWGPLDDHGKPIPERKGEEFDLWVRRIRKSGYKVEWRELRACDYGAPTSRKRLFLIARRDGLPIVWPAPTHGHPDSAEVKSGLRLPWRTAAECIDWTIPCPSIFDRARPLKDTTCRRIAAGVMRYVVTSAKPFIVPLTHHGSGTRIYDVAAPLPTVTGANRGEMALIVPTMIQIGYGEASGQAPRALDLGKPLGTVVAGGVKHALVAANLVKLRRNGGGEDLQSPLGTVTAGGKHHGLVTAFLAQHNTERGARANPGNPADAPMSTITGRGTQQQPVQVTLVHRDCLPPELLDHAQMVAALMIKYYGNEDGGHGLAAPLGTVTTRGRFAVITVTLQGDGGEAQSFVLVDIGMRMLTPRELANAQGFPPDYVLDPECWYKTDGGNRRFGRLPKSHQIAKIGNAVCPPMSEALVRANLPEMCRAQKAVA